MLSVSGLSVYFSGKYLFDDVSFLVNKNDRIGLVGKNGAGKSTLLKILAGKNKPEEGTISKPNGFTIGYLPQEMEHRDGKSVFDEALSAFEQLLKLNDEIEKLNDKISNTTDTSSDEFMQQLEQLHDAQEQFSMRGGYTMESETEKVLLGLGFTRKDFTKPTSEFSGGWRMRVELAKILLQSPDLLLLDEPTNHLDIEAIQWLEEFLKTYSGALIMVSHDRMFLDTVTNRTIEITLGSIEDYKASYSRYIELRAERKELQQAAYDNQQKQIQDLERFVERFKAKASKAKQAQSRVKMLEKIDRIEIEEEDNAAIRFHFPEPPRSGKVAVHVKHLSKSYGSKHVLDDISFELERGEHVAFVGKNGEGKSTLSKIIVGKEPYEGKIEFGHNTHIGYYAQNQTEELNGEKTVLQTIDDEATGEMRTKVRALLGAFLFSGETVDKKVKVLSGGEKARLALAKMLLQPINLLVMDEPTNHLDMRSKDLLKEALVQYSGALIIVSHDREFLHGLTSKVYEFRKKKIKQHIGDVYEYLQNRKIEHLNELNAATKAAKAEAVEKPVATETQLSREEKKQLENKRKKLERQVEESEEKIATLENKIAKMEAELAKPENLSKQQEMIKEYENFKIDLAKAMKEWEANQLELDELTEILA